MNVARLSETRAMQVTITNVALSEIEQTQAGRSNACPDLGYGDDAPVAFVFNEVVTIPHIESPHERDRCLLQADWRCIPSREAESVKYEPSKSVSPRSAIASKNVALPASVGADERSERDPHLARLLSSRGIDVLQRV